MKTMAAMNTVETASFQVSLIAGTPSEPVGNATVNVNVNSPEVTR